MARSKSTEGGDKEEKRVLQPTNLSELGKELEDFFNQVDAKKDSLETFGGEISLDIANIKEKFANKTGYTRAQLTEVYGEHRRELKKAKKRKERETAENDAIDTLMAAAEQVEGMPLFDRALDAAKSARTKKKAN